MRLARSILRGGVALLALAGADAGAQECEPWSGEPAPLPTLADPDPVRARWATLRAIELGRRARLAEPGDSVEAHRLWWRIRCLDPSSEDARRGLERTAPLVVHRPELVELAADAAPERARAAPTDWIAGLGAAVLMRAEPPAPPEPPPQPEPRQPPPQAGRQQPAALPPEEPEAPEPPAIDVNALAEARARELEGVDALLGEAAQALRTARFEQALERVDAARRRIAALDDGTDLRGRTAGLEVMSATAEIALGRDGLADASLSRALRADPGLRLDPSATSPRVLRALDAARAAGDATRAAGAAASARGEAP